MREVISTSLKEDGTLEIYLGNRLFVEVAGGRDDEDFIEDIIYGMGYKWLEDGTICPLKQPNMEVELTREQIYDELSALLTDYEERNDAYPDDLYDMLVKIQRNWEAVITRQEE